GRSRDTVASFHEPGPTQNRASAYILRAYPEHVQNFARDAFVLAQKTSQDMIRTDLGYTRLTGVFGSEHEYVLCARREWKPTSRHSPSAAPNSALGPGSDVIRGNTQ